MTDTNSAADLAIADQNYALAKELLAGPITHAKQLLDEKPGDEVAAWSLVADAVMDVISEHPAGLAGGLPYVIDLLAAAAVRLAQADPTP